MTAFGDQLYQYGGMPVLPGVPAFTGKAYFVDPAHGSDGNSGRKPSEALATLYAAHSLCTDGNNDVVFLISAPIAGATSTGTARLSTAIAKTVDSSATTGTLTWNKNATHLVGITTPGLYGRARIAPPTGTYTEATFNALPFVVTSGQGGFFANIDIYHGFSTGADGQIALTDSGARNNFYNCAILGMNDAASAQGTSSRSLKLTGGGESTFTNCVIGGDTTARTVANASLELAGGTPRNSFRNCLFPFWGSAAGVLGILGTGNGCMDRWALFDRCWFINNVKSTSTQMTVCASFTTASPGGMLVFANCNSVGMTKWGDTNALANSYVSGVGGAATDGLMLAPT